MSTELCVYSVCMEPTGMQRELVMYAKHVEQCGERTAVARLVDFTDLAIDDRGTLLLVD